MPRDGKGELITKEIESEPTAPPVVSCGGHLLTASGGRYRRCINGHVHCTQCLRQARRYRNAWTCGKCPGTKGTNSE